MKVLGPVPQGLPAFAFPWLQFGDLVPVVTGGICRRDRRFRRHQRAVANLCRADRGTRSIPTRRWSGWAPPISQPASSRASRSAAVRHGRRWPKRRGRRRSLPASSARCIVALLIVAAPTLFKDLPYSALAAVVIAAAIGLFEFADLARIYRIQQWEFWLSIVCTAGVAVFGAIPGIGIAIVLAIIEFLWDGWRPHSAVLGRADGVEGLPRHHPLSGSEADSRPGDVPLGRAAVLRQRRAVHRARARRRRHIADAGAPGRRRGGADHQRRRHGGGRSRGA